MALERTIFVVIIDPADLYATKVVAKIIVGHPEGSIVRGILIELLLQLRGPLVTVISPITVPLKVTPRISEFD